MKAQLEDIFVFWLGLFCWKNMKKVKEIKISFIPVQNDKSEKLLEIVYARIFQKAFENLVSKKSKNNL